MDSTKLLTVGLVLALGLFFVSGCLGGEEDVGDNLTEKDQPEENKTEDNDTVEDNEVTDVAIIGEDRAIEDSLENLEDVNPEILNLDQVKLVKDASDLDKYELFILTEKLGNNKTTMPSEFREHLSTRLDNGANLIIYGVAGSRVPDSVVNGWVQYGMDEYIPVKCEGPGSLCSGEKIKYTSDEVKLKILDPKQPIQKEFKIIYEFNQGTTINYPGKSSQNGSNKQFKSIPRKESDILALITVDENEVVIPAIVEKSYGVDSRAVYFAYNPVKTPQILENTVKYLME